MNYMNVCNENAVNLLNGMRARHHIPCFCKSQKVKISAPTIKRKTLKVTVTIEVEQKAFENIPSIFHDLGGFVVLGVAPENLAEEYR